MKIHNIQSERPDPKIVEAAAAVLKQGGIILHSTETVYGLAALWDHEQALQRVARIKGRHLTQPFSIMVKSVPQIQEISGIEDARLLRFLKELLPAPVTVLLPREKKFAVDYWNQFPFMGFRLPEHALSIALVEAAGKPLITTSANISGEPPPRELNEVSENVLKAVDLILDGGRCKYQIPSTVFELYWERKEISLIRTGAYPVEEIQRILKKY